MGKEIYGVLQEKQKKWANSLAKNEGNREKVKRKKKSKEIEVRKRKLRKRYARKREMRMKAVSKKRREINNWR